MKKYSFYFKKYFLSVFLSKFGIFYMEHHVELKYLLKCIPVIVLTLRNENYFQILIMKSSLQIVFFSFCRAAVSYAELF